jgi:hypothetical protein
VDDSLLHEVVCGQKPETLVAVGYMKLCLDIGLNCGRLLVLQSCQFLKSQSVLCGAVYRYK